MLCVVHLVRMGVRVGANSLFRFMLEQLNKLNIETRGGARNFHLGGLSPLTLEMLTNVLDVF